MALCGWCFKILLFIGLVLVAGGASNADGALVLSEILADPATDWNGDGALSSRDDEWVEVLNTGPETVDLGGYYVRDALGVEAQIRLADVLEPGEAKVFYGSDAVAWQQGVGYTVTGLSWNNTGDPIVPFFGLPAPVPSGWLGLRMLPR